MYSIQTILQHRGALIHLPPFIWSLSSLQSLSFLLVYTYNSSLHGTPPPSPTPLESDTYHTLHTPTFNPKCPLPMMQGERGPSGLASEVSAPLRSEVVLLSLRTLLLRVIVPFPSTANLWDVESDFLRPISLCTPRKLSGCTECERLRYLGSIDDLEPGEACCAWEIPTPSPVM